MISAKTSLMGALASLRDVQRQVADTLRSVDPNSTDATAVQARQDARKLQAEAGQKATEVAGALRKAALDVEA